jgi:hypothetical protein
MRTLEIVHRTLAADGGCAVSTFRLVAGSVQERVQVYSLHSPEHITPFKRR